jgi:hypothetical protein
MRGYRLDAALAGEHFCRSLGMIIHPGREVSP